MLTHDYHSNNNDGLNWATLRTFSKNRRLLDNEHVRQDGRPPRVGARRSRTILPQPPIWCIVLFGDKVCSCSFQVMLVIKHVEMLYIKRRGLTPGGGGVFPTPWGKTFFSVLFKYCSYFFHIAYFPKTTVDTLIEDIFLYNMILWDLC